MLISSTVHTVSLRFCGLVDVVNIDFVTLWHTHKKLNQKMQKRFFAQREKKKRKNLNQSAAQQQQLI